MSNVYHRCVEDYTGLFITFPEDIFPAFSGICRRFQDWHETYVAGLWSDTLNLDLMWTVSTGVRGSRPPVYLGPTWSWVSVQAPVRYPIEYHVGSYYCNRELAKRVSLGGIHGSTAVLIDVPGLNPYGRLCSAMIITNTSSVEARIMYITDIRQSMDQRNYALAINDKLDHGLVFSADYELKAEGQYQVSDGEYVSLILILPTVALVLRHVLDTDKWERIGIVLFNLVQAEILEWEDLWSQRSTVREFHIV
jgi:hypothetical protein